MSLASIVEQSLGALTGGAIAGVGAYVAIHSRVGKLETASVNLQASVDKCQSEREFCRKSMREHHEDVNNHVGEDLRTIIHDIQERIVRIETKLMNGSYHP